MSDRPSDDTPPSVAPGESASPNEAVLGELSAAFADTDRPNYDFDDPSIDRMLGLAADDPDHDIDHSVFDDDAYDLEDEALEAALADDHEVATPAAPAPPAAAVRTTIIIDDIDGDVRTVGAESVADLPHEMPDDLVGLAGSGSPVAGDRATIVIGDDDQPDAMYLDEEAEDRLRSLHEGAHDGDVAPGDTIVIGDLDADVVPTETAKDVALPRSSLDPRIRARRIAARRAESRKRLKWVIGAAAVVILVVAVLATLASPLFKASSVQVQGAVYTDRDVLSSVVDSIKGHPILLVDTAAAERTLEAVPWVESARVATSFPHSVVIDIRERRPLATFRGGDGKWRVIDVEGRVLDVIAGQPVAYMLVTGNHPDTPRGDYAGAPYATVAQLVAALPPEIRGRTTSINLDASTTNLSLVIDRGDRHSIVVHLGDGTALADKLARLLNQIHTGLAKVIAIDVSTEEVGVVRG